MVGSDALAGQTQLQVKHHDDLALTPGRLGVTKSCHSDRHYDDRGRGTVTVPVTSPSHGGLRIGCQLLRHGQVEIIAVIALAAALATSS